MNTYVEKVGWHKSKSVGTDSNASMERAHGVRAVCTYTSRFDPNTDARGPNPRLSSLSP